MPLRRMIRNFTDPVDARTAANLTRQIAELEDNVSGECDDIRRSTAQLTAIGLSIKASGTQIGPGQSAGFDTSQGDVAVQLVTPEAKHAGLSLLVWKIDAANGLTVNAPQNGFINRASTVTFAAVGCTRIFCDGVEYWIE